MLAMAKANKIAILMTVVSFTILELAYRIRYSSFLYIIQNSQHKTVSNCCGFYRAICSQLYIVYERGMFGSSVMGILFHKSYVSLCRSI